MKRKLSYSLLGKMDLESESSLKLAVNKLRLRFKTKVRTGGSSQVHGSFWPSYGRPELKKKSDSRIQNRNLNINFRYRIAWRSVIMFFFYYPYLCPNLSIFCWSVSWAASSCRARSSSMRSSFIRICRPLSSKLNIRRSSFQAMHRITVPKALLNCWSIRNKK